MTMTRVFKLARRWFVSGVTLTDKPLAAPEPDYEAAPRPAVGLFALLSSEQRAKVLAYTGDDHMDDANESFPRVAA
jgi:hypothetical protein